MIMQKRSNADISKARLTMHIEKLYVKETMENGKENLGVKYHLIHVGLGGGKGGGRPGEKGAGGVREAGEEGAGSGRFKPPVPPPPPPPPRGR